MSQETLLDYYGRRAHEYERIYRKPERQSDLIRLREHLRRVLGGHRVLELACGTGYWTAAIADTANSVLATDASDEVLAVARTKRLDSARVSFASADAYNPTHIHYQRDFTAGFAAFWWSHVLMARLPSFLEHFHAALLPGARVAFADNRFVPGSSTPICRMDDAGNTYELRYLQDGSSHEVLKNFPSREQLLASIRPYSDAVEILTFDYHWCVTYDIKEA